MKQSLAPQLSNSTPWKIFRKSLAIALGLSALAALPTFANDDEVEEPATWSSEFLAALEQWHRRYSDMSLAEYVAQERPDLLTEWVDQASSAMGGSILAAYEDAHPALVDIYEETYLEADADGNVQGDDASFVDFLIHGTDAATFAELETQVAKGKGRNLTTFVSAIDDGVVISNYQDLPMGEPIHQEPLTEFIAHSYQDPVLDLEAQLYVASAPKVASVCTCRVLAGVAGPSEDVDRPLRDTRPNGTLKWELSWWLSKRGAAHRLFTDRFIRNGLNELDLQTTRVAASIQFTMDCTRSVNGVPMQCTAGQGCSTQLKFDARYDSYVWVKNEATRTFPGQSFGSSVMTNDTFTLVANPGPSRQVLAEKGLMVQRTFGAALNARQILDGIRSANHIVASVDEALSTDQDFGTLLGNLNDEDFNNVLALITFPNDRGESSLGFASSYTNAGGQPLILPNGASHKLEMSSYSDAKSRGWGATSRSRSLTASSYYMVGAATNFACTSATAPAGPKVAWSYNSTWQAPYSTGAMRSYVDAFIQGTTGLNVSTAATNGSN